MACRLKPLFLPPEKVRRWLIPAIKNSTRLAQQAKSSTLPPPLQAPHSPATLAALFPTHHFAVPLVVEFCCGTGEFIIEAARAASTNTLFIGVDLAFPCLERAIKQAENQDTEKNNLLFYHGRAEDFLSWDFSHFTLNKAFINFPDPWPKKKHHKRRLINPHFVSLLLRRLPLGGEIFVATDVVALHKTHLDAFAAFPAFKQCSKNNSQTLPCAAYRFASKYQRKNLSRSKRVCYGHWKKQSS